MLERPSKLKCIISRLFLFALRRLDIRLRGAQTLSTEICYTLIVASLRGIQKTQQGAAHKRRWENTAGMRLLGLGVQGSLELGSAR